MSGSTFYTQFRALMWKNSVLKKRNRWTTGIEIVIPLIVIIIILSARGFNLKYNMDACFLREKQMDSMGPIPLVRDFLCTFNSTCYNKSQVNWNNNSTNEFLIFLMNITKIHSSYPRGKFDAWSMVDWLVNDSGKFEILNDSYTYWKRVSTPLFANLRMALSDNESEVREGILSLSPSLCGIEDNDVHILVDNFLGNKSWRSRPRNSSCRSVLRHYLTKSPLGSKIYEMIVPILFGKIFYTPKSNFTDELMRKTNFSFVILDKLRLSSVEWRLHFREWITRELNDGDSINLLRMVASECLSSERGKVARTCFIIDEVLNKTTNKMIIEDLTSLFAVLERVLNCTDLNKFVPLLSAADIDNLDTDRMIDVFAGIILDPSLRYLTRANATFLNYTIRMPSNRVDSTKRFRVLDLFWTPGPRVRTLYDMSYYTSGFLMLQEAVDRAFVDMVAGDGSADIGSSMQIMPSPCYVDDRFIKLAADFLPLLLVVAWLPSFLFLTRSIVFEKERRIKEFMLVTGLSISVLWLSWFVVALASMATVNLLITLVMKYLRIFEFSSLGVIFMLFFSYSVSVISQAFMFSAFFDNADLAALTSAMGYFLFYIPFYVLVNFEFDLTPVICFLTGTLSQVSFCNAIQLAVYWEQAKHGAQFGNLLQGTVITADFGIGHCIIMLWMDAVIYLLITWYVEAVFPGKCGIGRPWYFFATKRYWCSYKDDSSRGYELIEEDHGVVEDVPNDFEVGISIKNLTKTFAGLNIPAVNSLNLNFYKSQITAFLGHNGAGKTTTISMLVGMLPPSSGTAYVYNYDVTKSFDNVRQIIGICPQHSTLYDSLTVEDHIFFYGSLKGMTSEDIESNLPSVLADVVLSNDRRTISKNLSGGMKRKLNIALAFLGNSKVIFLDEPTAGVDPMARREIWDLIIKYRNRERTIVLTTHHMDEADYLSDRIAIISRGKLACCGSSAYLKRKFGKGNYITFVKTVSAQEEDFCEGNKSKSCKENFKIIKNYIDSAIFEKESKTQWTVLLPSDDLQQQRVVNLLQVLDESLNSRGIWSYSFSDTSLKEVFLKVIDDPSKSVQTNNDNDAFVPPSLHLSYEGDISSFSNNRDFLSGYALSRQQLRALLFKRFHCTKRNIRSLFSELILPILLIILMITLVTKINPFDNEPSMVIHPWLMMPRTNGMDLNTFYRKENVDNIKVNKLTGAYRSDVGESGVRCMNESVYFLKELHCYPTDNKWSDGPKGVITMQSPPNEGTQAGSPRCSNLLNGEPSNSHRQMASTDILHNLTGYNISQHLINRYSTYVNRQYGGYQFVLSSQYSITSKFIGESDMWNSLRESISISANSTADSKAVLFVDYFQQFNALAGFRENFTRIWINNKGYVSMPAYANIFDNLLLRSAINSSNNSSNYGIVVSTHPFKYSKQDLQSMASQKTRLEFRVTIIIVLALSLIPASFVAFLVEERVGGSKRQQLVSGVSTSIYWLSNFLWDVVKYLLSVLLIIVTFVALNYESLIGGKNLVAFGVILCCYGFAIIPQMYQFSFFISKPNTALVIMFLYNTLIGVLTLSATYFLDIVEADQSSLKPLNDLLKGLFLIFPQYGLGRGVLELAIEYMRYNISDGILDYKPFRWEISGKIIASFGAQFIFWWVIICVFERKLMHGTLFCKRNEECDLDLTEPLLNDESDRNVLKVINLTKKYKISGAICKCSKVQNKKGKIAVNRLNFDVKEGECFGLLGVNGSGKTSTIKMLTGEGSVTKGDASICGKSITSNMVEAHKDLGFCSQLDSLHDLLTCEEELIFYCEIRGIKRSSLRATVKSSLESLSLSAYTTKTIRTLSGGNKRKLSSAISLVGSPKLIILDEPTSGMDAGSRLLLWKRIQQLTKEGTAVLITSHNLEECEAFCDRLAIMIDGKFKFVGSVQELKAQFGNYHYITMHSSRDGTEEREDTKNQIKMEFNDGLKLKSENSVMMQYMINPSINMLSTIFPFFMNLKITQRILDYSICQATLDEVFINVSKQECVTHYFTNAAFHDTYV